MTRVKRDQQWRSLSWVDGDRQPVVWKVFAVRHGGRSIYYGWPGAAKASYCDDIDFFLRHNEPVDAQAANK